MNRVFILDSEMTGLKDPEVIEVAWSELRTGKDLVGDSDEISLDVCGSFEERFKPVKTTTYGALAVHHILPEELEGCRPSCEFKLPEGAAYLIGHSIDMDWWAIGSPDVRRICTNAMARCVLTTADSYNLGALTYFIMGANSITRQLVRDSHSARADVRMTYLLLKHILNQKPEITTWNQLWMFSEECRIPRTCPMKKHEGVLLEDLDPGFVHWCLNLPDLDPYFRKGLERVQRMQAGIYY